MSYIERGIYVYGIKYTTIEKGFGPAIIDDQIKNHANDPFVIKKVQKATETIKRVGLPDLLAPQAWGPV